MRLIWTAVAMAVTVVFPMLVPVTPVAAEVRVGYPNLMVSSDGSAVTLPGNIAWPAISAPYAGSRAGIDAIIGSDTRVPAGPTTDFPASATVLLTFTGGRCTGFMISWRTVATAGHCLHHGAGGTWRTNVVVYPGHNGTVAPYGSCAAVSLFAPAGWTNSSDERLDYGAAQLNCTIGNTTGWYGLGWTDESLVGTCTITRGYPNDRPSTQWLSEDFIRAQTPGRLYHQHDTVGGQDGSPLHIDDPDDWCPTRPIRPVPVPPEPEPGPWVLGIHTHGPHGGPPGATNNSGVRIDQTVFNNLMLLR